MATEQFKRLLRTNTFNLPLPVTLKAEHIRKIYRTHLVSVKSDGTRQAIVVHGDANDSIAVSLVDRQLQSKQIITIPLAQMPSGFNEYTGAFKYNDGCVLDCELLSEGSSPVGLQIFDCYVLGGFDTRSLRLSERLECAGTFVDAFASLTGLDMQVKPFYDIEHIPQILNSCTHRIDGLIFQSKRLPPGSNGRDPNSYKWKWNHTLDFEWSDSNWYIESNGGRILASDIGIRVLPATGQSAGIYECEQTGQNIWSPMQVRLDKQKANHLSTVQDTLRTINEGLFDPAELHRRFMLARQQRIKSDKSDTCQRYIIGIDVGLRNLAMCAIGQCSDGSTHIVNWQMYDCLGMKDAKKLSISECVDLVIARLRTVQLLNVPPQIIAIEQQPVGRAVSGNIRMKCVSHALQAILSVQYPDAEIVFVNPKLKFAQQLVQERMGDSLQAATVEEKKQTSKQRYAVHKKLTAQMVQQVVAGTSFEDWYNQLKKKDDAADAYLIALIAAQQSSAAKKRKKRAKKGTKGATNGDTKGDTNGGTKRKRT